MSEKPKSPAGNRKADTFLPPDTAAKLKRNPMAMSLDELIEYRKIGQVPPTIIQPGKIEELARLGNSVTTICAVLSMSKETFYKNPVFVTEFQKGRGNVATKIRQKLVEQALEEDNLQAMIYIDKIIGGDAETVNINATVSARPLKEISDEELDRAIEVTVNKNENPNN